MERYNSQQKHSESDGLASHSRRYQNAKLTFGETLETARRALLTPWAKSAADADAQLVLIGETLRSDLSGACIIKAGLQAILSDYVARHGPTEPAPVRLHHQQQLRGPHHHQSSTQPQQPTHGIVECVIEQPIQMVVDVNAVPTPAATTTEDDPNAASTAAAVPGGVERTPAQLAYRWARRHGLPVMMPPSKPHHRHSTADSANQTTAQPGEMTHFRLALYRAGVPERELALGAALRVLSVLSATDDSSKSSCPLRATRIRHQGRIYDTLADLVCDRPAAARPDEKERRSTTGRKDAKGDTESSTKDETTLPAADTTEPPAADKDEPPAADTTEPPAADTTEPPATTAEPPKTAEAADDAKSVSRDSESSEDAALAPDEGEAAPYFIGFQG